MCGNVWCKARLLRLGWVGKGESAALISTEQRQNGAKGKREEREGEKKEKDTNIKSERERDRREYLRKVVCIIITTGTINEDRETVEKLERKWNEIDQWENCFTMTRYAKMRI